MSPAEPIPSLLNNSLRPVAAPAELWDRVWQPRVQTRRGLQGFAFALPVAAAAALIGMVALTDPLHSPSGFRAVAPLAQRDSSDIASQLERRETILTVSSNAKNSERASAGTKMDAGCALCHTL